MTSRKPTLLAQDSSLQGTAVVRSLWRLAWQRLCRHRPAMAGLVLLAVVVPLVVLADWVAPYHYSTQIDDAVRQPPSARHWFGTDGLGRDVLSRVLYGARISMLVGLVATSISLLIGITVGVVAGFFGGWVDSFLMRVTDSFFAFPDLLLAIGISASLESEGIWVVFVALGLVGWTSIARVVRSQVLSIRENDYITAALAVGSRRRRVLVQHVLPNCLGPIIVLGTLQVASAILAEAALSFLGMGVQRPVPSWGVMLADAREYFQLFPWMCLAPGAAIVVTVLALNLLGDGLRDALDPKMT